MQYSHDLPQGGMKIMMFPGCKVTMNKVKSTLLYMKSQSHVLCKCQLESVVLVLVAIM